MRCTTVAGFPATASSRSNSAGGRRIDGSARRSLAWRPARVSRPTIVGTLPLIGKSKGKAFDFVHNVHKTNAMNTAYVSGRVPPRYERLVVKQARAAKTSKSDLVARYVIEKSL